MLLRNWLTLCISLSAFGCSSVNESPAPDMRVWVIDVQLQGAWGQTRYEEDKGLFRFWNEMENFVCFEPEQIPQLLRR